MKSLKSLLIAAIMAATCGAIVYTVAPATAESAFHSYRQRYSSWSYYPQRSYYYSTYYYRPTPTYVTYRYHYVIYYPARPRYVYYYNPYRSVYWGRYDLEAEGYSMLAQEDRKGNLDEIPESAFPKPGEMPPIPDSEDGARLEPPPKDSLPKAEPPADAPGGKR